LSAHYADFSKWQYEFSDEIVDQLLFYWKRKLKGKLQPLQLPTDKPRARIHTFHDGNRQFKIDKHLFDIIEKFCHRNKTLKYLVLLAAFKILLYRYSNQEEILVGISEENRNQPGLEYIVGPIANLLVLRSFLDGQANFLKVLKNLEKTVAEAQKYKDIPFERLDTELKLPKDMSRTAFFDVLFQYDEKPKEVIVQGKLEIKIMETNLGYGKYDLNLLLIENMNSISGFLVFNSDYYNQSTIARFITHYINLLKDSLENPHRQISALHFLTEKEKNQLLYDFNAAKTGFPRDKTIHQLFAEQSERTPGHVASVGKSLGTENTGPLANVNVFLPLPNNQIAYRELNEKSNRLSQWLKEKGVGPDTIVGIKVKRSVEMIIAFLGILKAGGAYLPIDEEYPRERIDYMLKDSGTAIFLTAGDVGPKHLQSLTNANTSPPGNTYAHNLAYVIYTSGTTGRPKGVLIEHRNVIQLLFNDAFQFDFGKNDTWTMFHSYCFDFSVWEMYGALLYGGKLVVVPKITAQDPERFLMLLRTQSVTVLNMTPSAFYLLADEELKRKKSPLALKYIIFGGEALNPGKLKEWKNSYPGIKLINMFGITETTVHVTYKEITAREIQLAVSNIGKSIPTLAAYVSDSRMNLVPIGVPGELSVGGDGVCRGYLNRPQLTREKFIDTAPFLKRKKIYRSGDLVKLLDNGEMVYLGRIDTQVKIRGHRIELAEIENQLTKFDTVKEAVVIDRQDKNGDKYLCAYVVHSPQQPNISEELKAYLVNKLPGYMIPLFFVILDKIPLTHNGKVDRKSLPEPEIDVRSEFVAPRNEVEHGIAYIIADVLGIDYFKVSVGANLFEMGVDSLKLVRIVHRISTEFNTNMDMSTFFTKPTIEEIVEDMQENFTPTGEKRPVLLNRASAPRNIFLISGDGVVYGMKELARLLQGHFNVYGIQGRGIMDTGQLPETREEVYEEYIREIKMVQPKGPYWLGGQCFGSYIGYELVRILEDQKEKVEKLFLFDEASVMANFHMDHMIINRAYHVIQSLKRIFKKIFGPKKKPEDRRKTSGLADNLDARRIEVRENFRRLFAGNYYQFKRIINTPVVTFKAFQGHYPDSHRWFPKVIVKMSTKSVEVVDVPGDHDSMFQEPHVQVLAERMLERIGPPED